MIPGLFFWCLDLQELCDLRPTSETVTAMTILTTPRLVLRPFDPADAEDLFAVFGNPAAMRYWSTLPHASVAVTARMIEQSLAADPSQHAEFAIEHDGKVIGKVGLWQMPEIGYVLHPDYWRRGIATEAVQAVIAHGFETLGLARITADVDPENLASLAMLKKLGFVVTGQAQNTIKIGGKWFDSIYLELAAPDR
ncbi:RimJ/RimL family protein N-acetyltransferase [Sulfitobacter mediterraneus]|uniref:RimJ/RimL family protein N-acetyltransferase n=2 Tax=Sulfitobacter mediterraneus TaxID=83219 RepID=A0A2T6CF22_9RHOB|nr:Acetyltransferase, GNAT family [Sulfitobacter mediterraneus KCTC 32188]PTX74117.1 RimJ/RimL family protein N-acetyltransferase [Sulfitobacter mediterraneus]